jgi:CO/xanthine dehydrogenase FAD-binding subunit
VDFLRPASLDEALAMKASAPDAVPIAGGTDVMVELNFDKSRPPALLDLGGVGELASWHAGNGHVRLGATVPYARIVTELAELLPGLAMASRTLAADPQPGQRRRQPRLRVSCR